MNWYKQAQINDPPYNLSSWFSKEIARTTDNNRLSVLYPEIDDITMDKVIQWVRDTKPDLSKLTLEEAIWSAKTSIAERQNTNPDLPNFMVDIIHKSKRAINTATKKQINNKIYELGNYHVQIPLKQIFDICKLHGVVPIQEDGKAWNGMLIGGAECGSDEARHQHAEFEVAIEIDEMKQYAVSRNNVLSLSWCKMGSGKYEIVAYIS